MGNPIYIFGHQNPDVDAICSAIGYAEFKKAIQHPELYVPARCGNSNDRINAILEYFRIPLPTFIGDVIPRVHDIMIPNPYKASLRFTCSEAIEIIDEHNFQALPVVDDNNQVQGFISIFELGEFFLPKPTHGYKMNGSYTSLNAIVRSLKGQPLNLIESEKIEPLFISIASIDLSSISNFNQSVVIAGNRPDIQQAAIDKRIRLLIVTDGATVHPDLIQEAKERGVSVIVSPYDTTATIWNLRSAAKIEPLVNKKPLIFGSDEKLSNVKRKITHTPVHSLYIVVGNEKELVGVFSMTELLKPVDTKIVLVDHNEMTQAVPGADEVTITEIIDHHRLGNLPTAYPIFFHNEPVGSTCTIIADFFRKEGLQPTQQIAGILMAGIVSDTLNLNSPTTTPKDKVILEWLEKNAQVAPTHLAELMFNSGSIILKSTPEAVIHSDRKLYTEATVSFSVSQIEEIGFDNFWNHQESIETALETLCKKENLLFAALLVTDVNTQNSLLILKGSEEFISVISYPVMKTGIFDLPGIVSRKKQLIPYLTTLLKTIGVSA
jgi:manganese-dependent inorganic pyrophosphatase